MTSMGLIAVLFLFFYQAERGLYLELERQTAELSRAVQIGLAGAAETGLDDGKNLESYLSRLNSKGIREITVISDADRIIASTRQEMVGKWITDERKELIYKAELGDTVVGQGQFFNVVIPIASGRSTFGYIHLTFDAKDLSAFLRHSAIRKLMAALFILGIGTLVAILLAGRYTRPIELVAEAAGKVAAGDLEQNLPSTRKDEIGDLSRNFNQLVDRLREDRDLKERLRTAEHLAGVGQVAQSIAHEIKNPLNFISLSIDHMRDAYRPDNPDQACRFESLVDNIKGEIQRISRFTRSFLEYGRPIELKKQPSSLTEIVNQVLELVAAQAEEVKIVLESTLEPLPEMSLDPEFIRTCLYNIVVNAFDAMPEGGILKISTAKSAAQISIRFADTGAGLEPESLDKIFEPYYTTKTGGLGLGLALTRKIIEGHGGRMEFESRPGVGSTVSLHLPLEKEQKA